MRRVNLESILPQPPELAEGTTTPLLVRAREQDTNELVDIVLKLVPPAGHTHEAYPTYVTCAEIIGTHILHAIGLHPAEPFWVSLTPIVIEITRDPVIRARLAGQPSHLFACRYLESGRYADVKINTPLKDPHHLTECHTLFGGDNWILNADRGRHFGAINLRISAEHIHPYDHGCAFTSLLNNPPTGTVSLSSAEQKNHIAHKPLMKKKRGNYDESFEQLIKDKVDEQLIDSLQAFCFEVGLHDFDIQKIFDHLKEKLGQTELFRTRLNQAFP